MVNKSKVNDPRFQKKWQESGAIGRMPGLAYAFFDCDAAKEDIEGGLPTLREFAQTPNELELTLKEEIAPKDFIGDLKYIAKDAKRAGIRYQIQAKLPGYDNKRAADEVADILNQAYQSPLYSDKEQFRGKVFYEQSGRYISRD